VVGETGVTEETQEARTGETGEAVWGGDPLPPGVRQAARDAAVVAAVAEIFRRNCRGPDGERRTFAPGEPEALARRMLERLVDPAHYLQVEAAGVRFDLEVGSEVYPVDPPVVWASVWDEDAEVWRRVGSVRLGPARADGAGGEESGPPGSGSVAPAGR
jgi:hypothetical protein